MQNNIGDLSVIITAGGNSSRYGQNKLLETINNKEVIIHSIEAFLNLNAKEIIVSVSKEFQDEFKLLLEKYNLLNVKTVLGGATRQASIYNALKVCQYKGLVAIHDAARPLVKEQDIKNCIYLAKDKNAAILAVKAVDTIKIVDENGKITQTPDRNTLWSVQTPQIFEYELIYNAHKILVGESFSDDAGMLEHLGYPVYVCEASYSNIKITTKKDIYLAQLLFNENV